MLKSKEKYFGIFSKFLWEDIFQDYLFNLIVTKNNDIPFGIILLIYDISGSPGSPPLTKEGNHSFWT